MRNQRQYNVNPRHLNEDERNIVEDVRSKTGVKLNVTRVQYLRHIPRATICIATVRRGLFFDNIELFGISVRSKSDTESPEVGRLLSFRRALEEYAEYQNKRRAK